MKKASIC